MNTKSCPKCGATWIDGQHYWIGTNKKGNETELASLVCDRMGDDTCINPAQGTTNGRGWEARFEGVKEVEKDMKRALGNHEQQ
jgi:hypothetical protein